MSFLFRIVPFLFLAAACTQNISHKDKDRPIDQFEDQGGIMLMTFNVENLFDTLDDDGKMDETYLPLADKQSQAHKDTCHEQNPDGGFRLERCLNWDWSQKLLRQKVQRLATVISSANNDNGADIVVLQEVENINALRMLNAGLGKKAYPNIVLEEGPDVRGIDIAIMTRLKVLGSQLHKIPVVEKGLSSRPTRSILQVDLETDDAEVITVFGVHFPSPGHPTEERQLAFETLLEAYSKLPSDRMVMAAGDFNVTSREDSEKKIVRKNMDRSFVASHKIGCQSCPGSSYYHPEEGDFRWSFLDIVFTSRNMLADGDAPYELDIGSIQLHNPHGFQSNRWGNPAHFLDREGVKVEGISDHWPITQRLRKRSK